VNHCDVGCEGRTPVTHDLGLTEAGVMLDDAGYIIGNNEGDRERSTVQNIYAIGDVLKVCLCSNNKVLPRWLQNDMPLPIAV